MNHVCAIKTGFLYLKNIKNPPKKYNIIIKMHKILADFDPFGFF